MYQGNEAKKRNYNRELFRYYQFVDSDTADKEFQIAVFANILVNPITEKGHCYSVDLRLKYINGAIR
jgi:hypothetical protein